MRRLPINFAIHFLPEQETRTHTGSSSQFHIVWELRETMVRVVPRGSYPHESTLNQISNHGQAFGLYLLRGRIDFGGEPSNRIGGRAGSIARYQELGDQRLNGYVKREPAGEAQIQRLCLPLRVRRN